MRSERIKNGTNVLILIIIYRNVEKGNITYEKNFVVESFKNYSKSCWFVYYMSKNS
jgi:hypothetical protein